eukprot:764253-Hanusia_phi.AAC.1
MKSFGHISVTNPVDAEVNAQPCGRDVSANKTRPRQHQAAFRWDILASLWGPEIYKNMKVFIANRSRSSHFPPPLVILHMDCNSYTARFAICLHESSTSHGLYADVRREDASRVMRNSCSSRMGGTVESQVRAEQVGDTIECRKIGRTCNRQQENQGGKRSNDRSRGRDEKQKKTKRKEEARGDEIRDANDTFMQLQECGSGDCNGGHWMITRTKRKRV